MNVISNINPDFQNLADNVANFAKSKQNWKDFTPTGVGTTILEMIAAVGTFNQYNIEQLFRESFPHTALRDSSIYEIARMLGVRIARKQPASYTCNLYNTSAFDVDIPKYSAFTIGSSIFFNRSQIRILAAGTQTTAKQVTLYEGTAVTTSFTSNGLPFQEFLLRNTDFVTSDLDISLYSVTTNTRVTTDWYNSDSPAWMIDSNEYSFYDSTDSDGTAIVSFGRKVPNNGDLVTITYAVTSGSSYQVLAGSPAVVYPNNSAVAGMVVANSGASGSDQKPAFYYKIVAPYLFRTRERAITKRDYEALALSYPGVAAVSVMGERDLIKLFGTDLRFMNVVWICVLPLSESLEQWDAGTWTQFLDWLGSKTHACIDIQQQNPQPIKLDIVIEIAMLPYVQEDKMRATISNNIKSLFTRGPLSLGRKFCLSDITTKSNITGVDYLNLRSVIDVTIPTSPRTVTADILPEKIQYLKLNSLVVQCKYTERTQYFSE